MSTVKDFVQALTTNPKAAELLKEAGEPANIEEAAALYADIAEKAGISVSGKIIREMLEGREAIQKNITAKAEGAVKEALAEAELDTVAGGQRPECASTYEPNEWCWVSDSCSVIITSYGQSHMSAIDYDSGESQDGESWEAIFYCDAMQKSYDLTGCYNVTAD